MKAVIDAPRLWKDIIETGRFGKTERGGVHRLALSDEDRRVRDWWVEACRAAHCTVTIDDMGNIFARRPGRREDLPPIAVGSHLDTQPSGGRFDGILGVLAGLEVVRTLNERGIETHHPIEIINWTNEEGARFAPAMMGSGVFAGVFDKDFALARTDLDGKPFGAELDRIGYRGHEICGSHALACYFELHIEQGPVLEAEEAVIGIVRGVQGMRWYDLTLEGTASHAGTTPMAMRRDASVAAAEIILAVNRLSEETGGGALSTTGVIDAHPNSRNVVPSRVFLTVDLRNTQTAVLDQMEQKLETFVPQICQRLNVEAHLERLWDSPPVRFDRECIEAVGKAARESEHACMEITSGAGHDSVYVSKVAPTAMIFIPCKDGLSHNELESAQPEHVGAGASVLLEAVLERDRTAR